MIDEIGEILKDVIDAESLAYIETLAGVVNKETTQKILDKDSVIEKSFAYYCPQKTDCEPNPTEALIPDVERASLFYFENIGPANVNDRSRGYTNFTAPIRLVAWLNPKKLGSPDCSITTGIIGEILKVLDKPTFNANNISKIKIRPDKLKTGQDSRNAFNKYKYGSKFYNLLEFPFDHFCIDFFVDFSIHENCINLFTVNPEIVC